MREDIILLRNVNEILILYWKSKTKRNIVWLKFKIWLITHVYTYICYCAKNSQSFLHKEFASSCFSFFASLRYVTLVESCYTDVLLYCLIRWL